MNFCKNLVITFYLGARFVYARVIRYCRETLQKAQSQELQVRHDELDRQLNCLLSAARSRNDVQLLRDFVRTIVGQKVFVSAANQATIQELEKNIAENSRKLGIPGITAKTRVRLEGLIRKHRDEIEKLKKGS